MTGLSKITDKILEEARQDAAARLSQADRECSAISAEYAGKADKIRNDIFERARNEAAGIVSRAKSTENMEKRNTQLAAKSRMIELAYETAKKQIADLPEERMLSFLVMLLCAAVAQRAEAEETSLRLYGTDESAEVYEVILNSRDAQRYGARLLPELVKKVQVQGAAQKTIAAKLKLSARTVDIDGGLILRCDDVEINCSLSSIFNTVRPKTERKVGEILFPEKKG